MRRRRPITRPLVQKTHIVWTLFSLAALALTYGFLPVPYTFYVQANDGNLRPADPITEQTPLQQCLDGKFDNVSSIDILLATYGRVNTSTGHVEIFTIENGKKNLLAQSDFSSSGLKDNDYFSITFPPVTASPKLCFLLTSPDATPQNGITYWLNSQSQPVLKVRSTVPLYKAMGQIAGANRFNLPMWTVVALCLVYLCANIGAIFLIWYEPKKSTHHLPKTTFPHSGRTR